MSHVPRASFCITLLDDQDYSALTCRDGGFEAFGVFVAVTLVARARLARDKAERIGETDALVLLERMSHVLRLANLSRERFDACLAAIRDAAEETGSEPWLYLDEHERIVIRSFFKFNAGNHGGEREGAGRPPSKTKPPKSSGNQVEIKSESSPAAPESSRESSPQLESASYSFSSSFSERESERGAGAGASDPDPDREPFDPGGNPPTLPPPPIAIGANSAAETREALDTAERLWPGEGVGNHVRQWLTTHTAARVVAAMLKAHDRKAARPGQYVASILASPEATPPARASPAAGRQPGKRYLTEAEIMARLPDL